MKISTFDQNQFEEIKEIKFEAGYLFRGKLDAKNAPFYGDILTTNETLIYSGPIIGNIIEYFREYKETGKIKKR